MSDRRILLGLLPTATALASLDPPWRAELRAALAPAAAPRDPILAALARTGGRPQVSFLSDRRRRELAIVGALFFKAASILLRPDLHRRWQDQALPEASRLVMERLQRAAMEPFAGLPAARAARLAARVDADADAVMAPWIEEQRSIMAVFAALFHWLVDRLDAEDLVLIEGSPGERAVTALLECLQDGFADAWAKVERRAPRQAAALQARLAARGYFPRARQGGGDA